MDSTVASLPLDVWEVIWASLGIRFRAMLELCSSTLRRQGAFIWHRSPVKQLIPNLDPPEGTLQVFITHPEAGRGLERFRHWAKLPIPAHLEKAFQYTTALTHVHVEESNCTVFNALVAARSPLKNVTIVSYSKEFYQQLDLSGFRVLKGTLRRLSLFVDSREFPPAPGALLNAIVTHLGPTLETLSLTIKNWAPLKPMTALKELFIANRHFQPQLVFPRGSLNVSADRLLEISPPGVGLNVVVLLRRGPTSLLMHIAGSGVYSFRNVADNYPVDVNLAPFDRFRTYDRRPLLFRAIMDSEYMLAHAMVQRGAHVFWPKATTNRSAFRLVLFQRTPSNAWYSFAAFLFDEIWPKAIRQWSATDLLGCPRDEILFDLLANYPNDNIADVAKIVWARREVFGILSPNQPNYKGCNLCHQCPDLDTAQALSALAVDWRAKDAAGHDALECLALSGHSPFFHALFQYWCQLDEDFIAHCTPLVWAMLDGEMDFESQATIDGGFQARVRRLLQLCPPDRWEEVVSSIHIKLRLESGVNYIGAWLAAGGAELRPSVLRAVFRPWSEISRSPWFTKYQLDEKCRQPLPHLLKKKEQLRLIGQLAKSHFPSQAAALEWIHERNDQGQAPEEYFIANRTSTEAKERTERLGLLWPADR